MRNFWPALHAYTFSSSSPRYNTPVFYYTINVHAYSEVTYQQIILKIGNQANVFSVNRLFYHHIHTNCRHCILECLDLITEQVINDLVLLSTFLTHVVSLCVQKPQLLLLIAACPAGGLHIAANGAIQLQSQCPQ